jgi:hypothetical protein
VTAGEHYSILIVDDDPIVVRVVANRLAEFSPLRFATSGTDASPPAGSSRMIEPPTICAAVKPNMCSAPTFLDEESELISQPMLDVNAAKDAVARECSASPPATQATIQDLLGLLDGRNLQALDRFSAAVKGGLIDCACSRRR